MKTVNLLLNREIQTADATLGRFWWENECLYHTVEDLQREVKIPGKTAIPCGRYQVIITMSNRFKRRLPLLLNVPGFEGVRIHAGNQAEDSSGCVLLGTAKTKNGVANSRFACDDFNGRLEKALLDGSEVWLTIRSVINVPRK